ncbi:MAG: hypothetical protein K8I00_13045, partial [Candidatus Omnitrophica bacterium]|nr:hypothetical protein [Candidatus Omnitrophota bacterium]
MLSTYIPYIISFLIGYLLIFCFQDKDRPLPPGLHIFLAVGLGLGVSAQITFWGFLIFKTFPQAFVIGGNLATLAGLSVWAAFQVRGKIW